MPEFSWVLLILLSAVCLGGYDLSQKDSVRNNAILPVLLCSTLVGLAAFSLLLCFQQNFRCLACSGQEYWMIWGKALIVGASWVAIGISLQFMPISIVSPVRSTSSLWTVLGGCLLYLEFPNGMQCLGMALIFIGYFFFSLVGRQEGVSLKGPGVFCLISGTLLGAVSSLYDRYLFSVCALDQDRGQFYFTLDLVILYGILLAAQRVWQTFKSENGNDGGQKSVQWPEFHWRWSILLNGILLVAMDWLYFRAVAMPDTQIGVMTLMRRCNVLISFGLGVWIFHERHALRKWLYLLLVLAGVMILSFCR